MKICPKCGMGHKDNAVICAQCYTSLKAADVDAEKIVEGFLAREEKREKRIKLINSLLIPLYYIIYIPLAVMCVLKDSESFVLMLIMLFFPLLYYLSVFKPEVGFYLEHMFSIKNIEDAEMSDWYLFTSKLGGYLILLCGIGIAIYLYCNLGVQPEYPPIA